MKLVMNDMQHDKKSKENWSVILDTLAPDVVLAQESLPPGQYQHPLFGDDWSENVVWAPVWPQWGSAIYLQSDLRPWRVQLRL